MWSKEACRVYKIRWVILALFVCCSISNSFQLIQFSVIHSKVAKFYSVSPSMVDMTSMLHVIANIFLMFPAVYLLDRFGVRSAVLIGSFGTCLGSWIKIHATAPHLFSVAFLGQSVVAVSQLCIVIIPPLLAAVWFGPGQVSTATSIGMVGNQLGMEAGLIFTPILVTNGTQEEVSKGLFVMFIGTALIATTLLVIIILVFKDKPRTPPCTAELARDTAGKEQFRKSIKRLLNNKQYILLLTSYGLNVGVFYSYKTLLGDFILMHHPDKYDDARRIGRIIDISESLGMLVSGFVLDKTQKFKETAFVFYFLSFCGLLSSTLILHYQIPILLTYIISSAIAFIMMGNFLIGIQLAAEITYPVSEGTSSGIMITLAQIFGIVLTATTRWTFETKGFLAANLSLTSLLLIGVVMTGLPKAKLNRTTANRVTLGSIAPNNVDD